MRLKKILKIVGFSFMIVAILSCSTINVFNHDLSLRIDKMREIDQEVQQNLMYALTQNKSKEEIDSLESSIQVVFNQNCKEAKHIHSEYGYPDFDLVGEKSSYNYWLIVQHCDKDIHLQRKVLRDLKTAVRKGKAHKENLAYLTDRVRKNQGKKQVYGTQVMRGELDGVYRPYPIENEKMVDKRRIEIGLEPLQKYLEFMNSQNN